MSTKLVPNEIPKKAGKKPKLITYTLKQMLDKERRRAKDLKSRLLDENNTHSNKASLLRELKWNLIRENKEYRREYNEWLNQPKEKIKSEYVRIGKKWGCPPANPDMFFPNIAETAGNPNPINPLNIPQAYTKHIQCGVEDLSLYKFFVEECSHIVNVNWISKDIFDYPIKEEEIRKRGPLEVLDPDNATTVNLTINLLYPPTEILGIIQEIVLDKFGRNMKFESFEGVEESELKFIDLPQIAISEREMEKFDRIDEAADNMYSDETNDRETPQDIIEAMERKNVDKFFDWFNVYKIRSNGIVERSVLKKYFSNGGSIFDWLMKNNYFEENSSIEGYPNELTNNMRKAFKKEYSIESKKILPILEKRKTWVEIGKEARFYGFEKKEFKNAITVSSLLKELVKKGIKVSADDDEIEKLNKLLNSKDLYKYFPEEADWAGHKTNFEGNELIHSNRLILETAYPEKCPMKNVDDETLKKQAKHEFKMANWLINQMGYKHIR